mgnify:CR=1 FL=1
MTSNKIKVSDEFGPNEEHAPLQPIERQATNGKNQVDVQPDKSKLGESLHVLQNSAEKATSLLRSQTLISIPLLGADVGDGYYSAGPEPDSSVGVHFKSLTP